ncbi:MAG: bifunctional protein HldE [Deltaproteobacteria bacterium]|nr:MAG: bifunctional protein HldE [Deltaproteobacteria bacterium]
MNTVLIIERFCRLRVIVIGDIMLDRYIRGEVKRISPEAPVPVLKVSEERLLPGGAANVARNLKSLGASVKLFGVTGEDIEGKELLELIKQEGIDTRNIIVDPERPTTTKTRLIAESQQITRVDREEVKPIPDRVMDKLITAISESFKKDKPHGVIISDYGKGVIRKELSQAVIQLARRNGVFVAVDPKGKDFSKYRGTNAITPNQRETEEVCGFPIKDESDLKRAVEILVKQTETDGILITRGKQGISFYVVGNESQVKTIPSDAKEVFDVTGAGDTVVSTFTLAYLSSGSWEDSVKIANTAAGIVVGRLGAATVSSEELLEHLNNRYTYQRKILRRDTLLLTASQLKSAGKKIVFTNGCFDLFHTGHLHLLEEAKKLGDVLIVAINSDQSVKRLKGAQRPIFDENERAKIIAALGFVDYVVVFEEDTPFELIEELKPDIIVKGGDYTVERVVGRDIVESHGGRVHIIPLLEGVSTSSLIEKIKNL